MNETSPVGATKNGQGFNGEFNKFNESYAGQLQANYSNLQGRVLRNWLIKLADHSSSNSLIINVYNSLNSLNSPFIIGAYRTTNFRVATPCSVVMRTR